MTPRFYKVGTTNRQWVDGALWYNNHYVELEDHKELPERIGETKAVKFGWRDWDADVYHQVTINIKRVQ